MEVLAVFSRMIWLPVCVLVAASVVFGVAWMTRPAGSTDGVATARTPTAVESTTPVEPSPASSIADPLPSVPQDTDTMHYISNAGPNIDTISGLGFNLFDLGPDKSRIDALGPNQKALVWLGNLDNTNCTPGYSWSEFTSAVRRLAHDPKVFGYYISDEPHPSECPQTASHIRKRADYIREQDPAQKSFIVVMDASRLCGDDMGCEYRQLRPSITHVDLVGIDPFPCRVSGGCSADKVDLEVARAVRGGIPVESIVPVFQVFGQDCAAKQTKFYSQPSPSELAAMLNHWAALVPNPAFDFAYTWRSEGPACPALDRATGHNGYPNLQAVIKQHNAG